MKSTSANRLLFLVVVSLSFSCSYLNEKDLATGNWRYVAITKLDSSIMEIDENDIMVLNQDSSFEYHIAAVNKHMSGKWNLSKNTLHLSYLKPDTIRHFEIDILSKYYMKFHEGLTYFEFKKVD